MAARAVRLPLLLVALAASALRPYPSSPRAASRLAATSSLGYDLSTLVEDDLGALPPLSRDVLAGGTEPANRGETACGLYFEQLRPIFREKRPAVFATALGGLPVFSSADALDLTSGWPAFRRPLALDHIILKPDGDTAFECLCARSGAHLGHRVSEDYYCINAAALVVLQPGDALPVGAVPGVRVEEVPPVLAAVLGVVIGTDPNTCGVTGHTVIVHKGCPAENPDCTNGGDRIGCCVLA